MYHSSLSVFMMSKTPSGKKSIMKVPNQEVAWQLKWLWLVPGGPFLFGVNGLRQAISPCGQFPH